MGSTASHFDFDWINLKSGVSTLDCIIGGFALSWTFLCNLTDVQRDSLAARLPMYWKCLRVGCHFVMREERLGRVRPGVRLSGIDYRIPCSSSVISCVVATFAVDGS